jgi:hypothetical protein
VRPRDVRHRATLVRAAIHPTSSARRPVVLLVLGAILGICGWLVMTVAIVESFGLIEDRSLIAGPLPALVAAAAYLFGVILFAWAWELGDPPKAAKFALTAAVVGIGIWLIVALGAVVLVALGGGSKGGGSSGGGSGGGSSTSSGHGGSSNSGGGSSGGGAAGGSSHTISMDWYALGRALDGTARTFVPPGRGPEDATDDSPSVPTSRKGVCPFCGAAMWAEAATCPSCGGTAGADADPAP